jgi:hypothetical protein
MAHDATIARFIDEERYETGHIIAQISDGYYLAKFDCIEKGAPPPRLEARDWVTQ